MNKKSLLFLFFCLFLGVSYELSAQCTSAAGTINAGTYQICTSQGLSVNQTGMVLDANDGRMFIVHTGTATQIGTVVYSTTINWIPFDAQKMTTGIAYQVAAVVGNASGNNVDLNDPCLSIAGGITLTFITPPSVSVPTPALLSCTNNPSVTLTATVAPTGPNYQYQWWGPTNLVSTAATATLTQPGFYSLQVTDPTSNCSVFDSIFIQGDQTIPTASISVSNAACQEATFKANTNNPQNTFLWSTGHTTATIQADETAQYCVTITSPQGCTATACRNFNVGNGPLSVTIRALGNGNLCTDSLGLLAVATGGAAAYTYRWSNGVSPIGAFYFPQTPGQYSVTATDGNGCTAIASYFVETGIDDCGAIKGKIFADFNQDCQLNGTDVGLQRIAVKLEKSTGEIFYVYTKADGTYELPVPTGSYTVSAVTIGTPWNPCQPSYSATVTFGGSVTVNIPLQAAHNCPGMTVDIGSTWLRRCSNTNWYYVNYCNTGTTVAAGAYVAVHFDAFLTVESATVPYTDQGNNTYHFALGDVPINFCGSFNIKVGVSCDAVLGQTHCVEATAFPHDPCPPANANWSGASVALSAECTGSELRFRAKNKGTAPMTQALEYVIIEDAVMLRMAPGVPLNVGEDRVVFSTPANGATWRIEAKQEPLHPGKSAPALSVEGCATGQSFSLGFVNQYETDDADPWVDIFCQENRASYDPNDKRGLPDGYGPLRQIKRNTDIEYTIRFQNTGTDTAFAVVIRDTLAASLDAGTVVPGASSHPYKFSYYGENHLKFTFDPIVLPDSNVNRLGSQGFVSFRVSQRPNLPLGTVIKNRAGIYFDMNAPIITNTTTHRIGENFISVGTWAPVLPGLSLGIRPNPATDHAYLSLKGLPNTNDWDLEILDALGRPVLRQTVSGSTEYRLERGQLPSGTYLIRLSQAGRSLGTGKLMLF